MEASDGPSRRDERGIGVCKQSKIPFSRTARAEKSGSQDKRLRRRDALRNQLKDGADPGCAAGLSGAVEDSTMHQQWPITGRAAVRVAVEGVQHGLGPGSCRSRELKDNSVSAKLRRREVRKRGRSAWACSQIGGSVEIPRGVKNQTSEWRNAGVGAVPGETENRRLCPAATR